MPALYRRGMKNVPGDVCGLSGEAERWEIRKNRPNKGWDMPETGVGVGWKWGRWGGEAVGAAPFQTLEEGIFDS